MTPPDDLAEQSEAFWRETVRRGVMALGFKLVRQGLKAELVAEVTALREGWTHIAALAAITVHKMIEDDSKSGAHSASQALARELRTSPAAREIVIYRSLLIERVCREIRDAPAERLQSLADGLTRHAD